MEAFFNLASHLLQRWASEKENPFLDKKSLRPRFFLHVYNLFIFLGTECRYLTIGRRNYLSKELAGGEVSMDCISFLGLQKPMELLISIIIIILAIIIVITYIYMCVCGVFRLDFPNKTRPPQAKKQGDLSSNHQFTINSTRTFCWTKKLDMNIETKNPVIQLGSFFGEQPGFRPIVSLTWSILNS